MRLLRLSAPCLVFLLALSGCFGGEEEEKAKAKPKPPAKHHVTVVNETGVDFKVRVSTHMSNYIDLPFAKTERIEFKAKKSKTVQVEAKSMDPNWNGCVLAFQVGQTMTVYQDGELHKCKAE